MNGYVELITGTLGGGKTLFAVERIFEHLALGGYVFTNIAMKPDAIRAALEVRKRKKFDPSRLVVWTGDEAREPQNHVMRGTAERCVMLVIDEAGLEHNARDWAKTDRDFIALNALARKMELVVLYISQQATDFDKQVRSRCRAEWQCRNLHNLRLFGVLPVKVPLYARVCYDITKGKREYVTYDVLPLPMWVCELYDSNALVGRGKEALEKLVQATATPLEDVPAPPVTPEQLRRRVVLVSVALCAFAFGFSSV